MHVRTSNSGRSAGVAKRTPLVAIVGTRNADGETDERVVVALFVAPQMALQLDVDAVAAEDADEAIEQAADAVPPAVERARGPRARRGRAVEPSSSSSVSAPSPFGARSFIRVISRQRFR